MMKLNEAMKTVKKLPPAVTDAMKIDTPHHKAHHHGDSAQLLEQKAALKKKGIEEALDKAKETLSNMMEETETELDEAILSCKEYDAQTTATLDENAAYRAQLGGQVAEAKGMIAEAKMMITQAKTELDSLKTISEEHARQCELTITTQQAGLAILEADLAVSMRVENMTDCDDVTPGSTTTLMQCGTGYARRFKFAGHAAYDGFAQLKSKEGPDAVRHGLRSPLQVCRPRRLRWIRAAQVEGGPCCSAAHGQDDLETRPWGGLLRQREVRPGEEDHSQGGRSASPQPFGQDEERPGAGVQENGCSFDAVAGRGQPVEPPLC